MTNIRNSSVKKVLSELKSLSESNSEKYLEFIKQYNRPLKEGLYSDFTNRDALLELIRFKSSENEGYVSLSDYVEKMGEDQKAIYYITGGNEETLRNSPLLEAYKKKGIEVLIMDDEIDDIVIPTIGKYKEKDLKAVNRSGADEDLKTDDDKAKEEEVKPLIEKIKEALGDEVKDVKSSSRLSDSPSCIIADADDPTMQMQQMLKAMGQTEMPDFKPILEINPDHEIVKKLSGSEDKDLISDVSFLLLEQAKLIEGGEIKSPADFVKRLNRIMGKAVN